MKARVDFLRYASVWEDADILCEALAPAARGGRVLSIASAGDNALALLTLDPAEVVAVDMSQPQLAATELRVAAWRELSYQELLAFLGVTPSADRAVAYRALRPRLSPDAQSYWDARADAIRHGPMHAGKFERYLRAFGRVVLPLVHSRRTIGRLLEPRERDARVRFYDSAWNTRRWRLIFRIFFSRAVMGRMGRDPTFFAHVQGTVAERILARTRHALTELPVHTNPYATYILTGSYAPHALPLYLRPESHARIRERLDRLRLVHGPAQDAGGDFDAFNLSDIFEYMGPADHERVYGSLLGMARPGARLAYWDVLAIRPPPAAHRHRVRQHDDLARALHLRDKAWFYGAFHVDELTA